MEKREPSLAPEWLKSTGNGSGAGSKNHILSSSSRSDSSLSHSSKSRNSKSKTDVDSVRSPFLDWSSSTNARKGFSNGSTKNAYSSFNVQRNHRDNDWSREKDRLSYMEPWEHDTSFPCGTSLNGRNQEQLRRSNSMTIRKQGDHLAQGFTMGSKNGRSINICNTNGILPGTSPAKTAKNSGFDKDFPSLRAEERNGGPDIVRISSPNLSPAVQSLSVGTSGLIAGEGWTSALAEVPNVIEKSGSDSHANVGTSVTLMGQTCRNMAEALVQAPGTGTPPQGSSKIQRLEDRALKQSRQLVPVLPSAPKGSVLNSSDKSKIKPLVRSGDIGLASLRNTHQQSSMLLGSLHSSPGSQIKPDTTKKLVVLKPARENGVSAVKESGSPIGITNSRAAASQMTAAPSAQFTASVRSTTNLRELRGASVNMLTEKKLSVAQTQSRSAFYSALKKKISSNISTDPSKTSSCILSTVKEKANISQEVVASDPSSVQAAERDDIVMEIVEKVSEVAERNSAFESADRPDEKEAEFLKSLGWDENNTEEDEALTEEEIRAFIEQCKKLKPSLVQKLPIIQEATEDLTPNS